MATILVIDCNVQNPIVLTSLLGYSGYLMVEAAGGAKCRLLNEMRALREPRLIFKNRSGTPDLLRPLKVAVEIGARGAAKSTRAKTKYL